MEGIKILVAYATRYGSAEIVGRDIASYFKEKGAELDLVNLKTGRPGKKEIGLYDLVIVGSSVAMFMWMGEAKRFLRKCKVSGTNTAIYITCGMAIKEPEKAKARFMDKVIGRIGIDPVLAEPLPPVIDFRPEGISASLKNRIHHTIKAMAEDNYQEDGLMDFRNPDEFAAFLKRLGALLD